MGTKVSFIYSTIFFIPNINIFLFLCASYPPPIHPCPSPTYFPSPGHTPCHPRHFTFTLTDNRQQNTDSIAVSMPASLVGWWEGYLVLKFIPNVSKGQWEGSPAMINQEEVNCTD